MRVNEVIIHGASLIVPGPSRMRKSLHSISIISTVQDIVRAMHEPGDLRKDEAA
jgi:hypothetical protein